MIHGLGSRSRTHGLMLPKHALYQLSYTEMTLRLSSDQGDMKSRMPGALLPMQINAAPPIDWPGVDHQKSPVKPHA